jgi:hypothetical protein
MSKFCVLLFVVCGCVVACFARTRDTAVIVRPDFQKSVIGFDCSPDDNQEFCDYIVKRLSNALGLSLVVMDRSELQAGPVQKSPVFCFVITDSHMVTVGVGERDGFVASILYKFEGNSDSSVVHYVTPGNLLSMGGWGYNKPFKSALRMNLDELSQTIRRVKTPAHSNPVRLDSLLRDERFVNCGGKAYLVQPEFSDSTFGYTPTGEEIYDFTRFISSHLSKVLSADIRIVSEKEASGIRDCCGLLARVTFHVPGRSVAFSLERKGVTPVDKVYENLDVKDWNENHIFVKGLDHLFNLMDKDMKFADIRVPALTTLK